MRPEPPQERRSAGHHRAGTRSRSRLAANLGLLTALGGAVLPAACADLTPFRRAATPAERQAGDALATQMVDGLGGMAAYRRLRRLSFDFAVTVAGVEVLRRHHDWAPGEGVARVAHGQGDDRVEVWLDLSTRQGVVHLGGVPVPEGPKRREHLDEAYQAWTNDTYWVVAPFKVFDQGVLRARVGPKLRTRFADVGLTPGDAYLYDFHADGRLAGWEFLLESGVRAEARWMDPVRQAGLTLHTLKTGSLGSIHIEGLVASETPSPELFKAPPLP